jgi:hypothetical protein
MVGSKQQIPDLLKLAKLSCLLSIKPTALKTNAIEAPHPAGLPFY